jgi:small-conductance mechanosensitive channel
METLKAVAKTTPRVLEKPQPFVRFENYGESSLDFSVYFYTTEIFRAENIKSDMRVKIFTALKAKGINIPFPQRVIRMKKDENKESI